MRLIPWSGLPVALLLAGLSWSAPIGVITGIDISGNSRTRENAILEAAGVSVGDPWADGLEQVVEKRLHATRLFYDVGVEARVEDGGVRLSIRVRERWSIIALPLVAVREGETTVGLTVMESNLLGLNVSLAGTFLYHDGRAEGFLFYSDRHLLEDRGRVFIMLHDGSERVEEWRGDETVNAYEETAAGGTFGLGANLSRRLALSLTWTLRDRRYGREEETVSLPAGGRESLAGVVLELEPAGQREEVSTGFAGRLWWSRGAAALGSDFDMEQYGWWLRWSGRHLERNTLQVSSRLAVGHDLPYGRELRLEGLKGYERDRFRTDRGLVAGVEYVVPLRSFSQANLSLAAFADGALLRDGEHRFNVSDAEWDAGISCRVYLRRVMVPLLELYLAYGFSTRRLMPGFTLGFMF